MIPIDVGFNGKWLSSVLPAALFIESLVDTGADHTMAPLWIADSLQIPTASRIKGVTVGVENNPLTIWYVDAQIKLGGYTINVCVGFGKTIQYPLLGRAEILDTFLLKMDYPNFFELIPRAPLH